MHRRPAGAPARRCRASRKWLQRPMHEAYEAAWALAPRRIEDPRPGHAGDCPGQPSGSNRRRRAPAARANAGRGGRPRRTRRTATAHLVTCAQARGERVSHRARADGGGARRHAPKCGSSAACRMRRACPPSARGTPRAQRPVVATLQKGSASPPLRPRGIGHHRQHGPHAPRIDTPQGPSRRTARGRR
jgi:hypothetical protein